VIAGGIATVMAVAVSLFIYSRIPNSPEDALRRFRMSQDAEDQLMDPLILAGKSVVPLLIKEVQSKEAPRRRYAIHALGQLGDSSVLETLKTVLSDPSEADFFRCDALEAIALIDREKGNGLAQQKDLGQICSFTVQAILSNAPLDRRSYFDALLGTHE